MRRFSTTLSIAALVFLLAEALPGTAWAQTGKLAGRITDAAGDAIPGATVLLQETRQGAATDLQGRYVIIGISPGNGATGNVALDPGAQAFAPAGAGSGGPNDMLYEFNDVSVTLSGIPASVAGGLSSLIFAPNVAGGYDWAGL